MTVNDTENYLWKDFKNRVINVVNNLYVVYPSKNKFIPKQLILKYVDAIDLKKDEEIYNFLREKMKLNLSLNPLLFKKTSVDANPVQFDL
ncbi:hypothetical protein IQ238_28980 [Pleurocapsales cyanobacterium LEGE 06147]|nr:hypothetical protein [Pleurocapsales cyanobacterium LEGE 06147]